MFLPHNPIDFDKIADTFDILTVMQSGLFLGNPDIRLIPLRQYL